MFSWVDECQGEKGMYHDNNRRTSTFEYVGQNYASKYHSSSLGDKFLAEMIQLLYDEVIIIWIHLVINNKTSNEL